MMEEWKKVLAWIERFSSHPLTDEEDDIAFLADYDDGSTFTFVIDRWLLDPRPTEGRQSFRRSRFSR